jgi:hypothetical protein
MEKEIRNQPKRKKRRIRDTSQRRAYRDNKMREGLANKVEAFCIKHYGYT